MFRLTMTVYSNRDQTIMIFTYGRVNRNGLEVARLCQIAFQYRRQLSHPTFVAFYHRAAVTMSVAKFLKVFFDCILDSIFKNV